MAVIAEHREALRHADIAGKFNSHVAGFSPTGQHRLDIELPCIEIYLAAKATYGFDVFTSRRKRDLFKKEHPEYVMTIRR